MSNVFGRRSTINFYSTSNSTTTTFANSCNSRKNARTHRYNRIITSNFNLSTDLNFWTKRNSQNVGRNGSKSTPYFYRTRRTRNFTVTFKIYRTRITNSIFTYITSLLISSRRRLSTTRLYWTTSGNTIITTLSITIRLYRTIGNVYSMITSYKSHKVAYRLRHYPKISNLFNTKLNSLNTECSLLLKLMMDRRIYRYKLRLFTFCSYIGRTVLWRMFYHLRIVKGLLLSNIFSSTTANRTCRNAKLYRSSINYRYMKNESTTHYQID